MKKITRILFALMMIMALSFSLASAAFADSSMDGYTSFEEWWNSSETVQMDYDNDMAAAQAAWDAAHSTSSGESDSSTTGESGSSTTGESTTTTPMDSFTSFSEWWATMSDAEKSSSYGNDEATAKAAWDAAHPAYTPTSSATTLNIALTNATLNGNTAFVSSYSTTKGDKVIAYNIILTDANGNVSNGNAAGKYTMSVDLSSVRVYDITDTSFSNDLSGNYVISATPATMTRTANYTGTNSGSTTTGSNGTSYSGTTSSTTSVKTGDENNIGLWVAISVIALAGVSAVSVVMIRRKASK